MRVLDLSTGIAGAYCTKLLADYGARVIKLEPPQVGDPVRRRGPFPDDIYDSEKSGLFLFLNTNKEGITLNLADTFHARPLQAQIESHLCPQKVR